MKNFEILIVLSLAIGLLAIELTGFIFGLSMFMPAASVLSIGCHASAAIALSYALFDSWDSSIYWTVFALFSVPPGLVEVINAVNILVLKRV
ncbi:transmembrane protein 107-like [Nilaparvata lugens]|nr:transmembrane protein 107-like [Nilaparvata lugens]